MMSNEKDDPAAVLEKRLEFIPSQKLTDLDRNFFAFRHFISGAGAGLISLTITFPINKVMFRQQLDGLRVRYAVGQIYREGITNLYRGILPPLLHRTTSLSSMYGTYQSYFKFFRTTSDSKCFVIPVASTMAGATEAILLPFERTQTILLNRRYNHAYDNFFHVIRELKPYGLKEFYRGLSMVLIRNCVSNTLFFSLREPIRDSLPTSSTHEKKTNLARNFVSGAVLGAGISSFIFPVNVVKTRLQSKIGGNFENPLTVYRIVFNEREHSWKKMYRGVHVNYTRSMIYWGLNNCLYEFFKSYYFKER